VQGWDPVVVARTEVVWMPAACPQPLRHYQQPRRRLPKALRRGDLRAPNPGGGAQFDSMSLARNGMSDCFCDTAGLRPALGTDGECARSFGCRPSPPARSRSQRAAPPAGRRARAAQGPAEPRRARSRPRTCPNRKPPFLAVKRPARPYKSAIESRFTMENAKGV
jgi:hypothetical protein